MATFTVTTARRIDANLLPAFLVLVFSPYIAAYYACNLASRLYAAFLAATAVRYPEATPVYPEAIPVYPEAYPVVSFAPVAYYASNETVALVVAELVDEPAPEATTETAPVVEPIAVEPALVETAPVAQDEPAEVVAELVEETATETATEAEREETAPKAPAVETAPVADQYEPLTYRELQAACKAAGLKACGKREDLLARLKDHANKHGR